MLISKEVLDKILNKEISLDEFKYKRYIISPCRYYGGEEYIYAENIEEAKKIMYSYIEFDKNNNKDTGGFDYIYEDEDGVLSTTKSPIYKTKKEFDKNYHNGIYYIG